jgi:sugar phosphate isomerase/epimerase
MCWPPGKSERRYAGVTHIDATSLSPGAVEKVKALVASTKVSISGLGLDQHGVLSYPKLWHTPKIPGLGDVRWGSFFGSLSDAGYSGHVAIEVEDRAFEGSLEARLESLVISRRYLLQYCCG